MPTPPPNLAGAGTTRASWLLLQRVLRSAERTFCLETRMDRFHLTKWYLDCAHAGGEAFIGYWAELRWRRIKVRYASTMLFAGGVLQERYSLQPGPEPQMADGLLRWDCEALETRGLWAAAGPSPEKRILDQQDSGRLEWHCLQPLAEADVICEGRRVRGQGYSEKLTLTIPPWNLPMDDLRWGRAHFPGRSVVWIDWTGPTKLRLVFVNGMEAEGAWITDDEFATSRIAVRLTARQVLREGPLSRTTAGSIPGVRQALSRAGLLLDEHKWFSMATLEEGDAVFSGTAIHEVVKWR